MIIFELKEYLGKAGKSDYFFATGRLHF